MSNFITLTSHKFGNAVRLRKDLVVFYGNTPDGFTEIGLIGAPGTVQVKEPSAEIDLLLDEFPFVTLNVEYQNEKFPINVRRDRIASFESLPGHNVTQVVLDEDMSAHIPVVETSEELENLLVTA